MALEFRRQSDLIATKTITASLVWNYIYGLGQRLARSYSTDKMIYHNDHLGNVRAITKQDGSVTGKEDYYPYGKQLEVTGTPGKYTYNGKEYLDDWGYDLYYYGARFMDPATGRFMTPDPIKGPLNPYSYVGNGLMKSEKHFMKMISE